MNHWTRLLRTKNFMDKIIHFNVNIGGIMCEIDYQDDSEDDWGEIQEEQEHKEFLERLSYSHGEINVHQSGTEKI